MYISHKWLYKNIYAKKLLHNNKISTFITTFIHPRRNHYDQSLGLRFFRHFTYIHFRSPTELILENMSLTPPQRKLFKLFKGCLQCPLRNTRNPLNKRQMGRHGRRHNLFSPARKSFRRDGVGGAGCVMSLPPTPIRRRSSSIPIHNKYK